MLACIEVLLRPYPAVRDVDCSTWVISSFLGPPPNLSLSEACALSSPKLLDWIWASSCTSVEARTRQWTLTNYLRSDPHYYRFQFAKGLEVAADRGDLAVVKWILVHFSDCEAPYNVASAAASKGNLHVLKFLWGHRRLTNSAKRRKVLATDDTGQRNGGGNSDLWGDGVMLDAATNGHFHVVRWLCEFTPHNKFGSSYDRVIQLALSAGDDELVQFLLPPGRCVLDYAAKCPRLDVIEWMLECGYLRRDAGSAASAIRDLAGTGRLDLMQQIALLHSPLPEFHSGVFTSNHWYDAIGKTSECGDLAAVQWLMEYPIEISPWQLSKTLRYGRNPFVLAAGAGQCRVVEYLCQQKVMDEIMRPLVLQDDVAPLRSAICNGHIKCVEVILRKASLRANWPPGFCPVDVAAGCGQLEVLKFLLVDEDAWWSHTRDPISSAAEGGHLEVVKWLLENHAGSVYRTDALCKAAAGGHLEVVQWLVENTNGSKKRTRNALHSAAINGHLEVVEWLHAHGFESCGQETMDLAAAFKRLDVMKWLHKNLPGGFTCTVEMVEDATLNGPLRTASWLHDEFLACVPADLNGIRSTYNPDKFEMLLFQYAHYPHLITPKFIAVTIEIVRKYGSSAERLYMIQWLEELAASQEGAEAFSS